jgi:hypothetical protein
MANVNLKSSPDVDRNRDVLATPTADVIVYAHLERRSGHKPRAVVQVYAREGPNRKYRGILETSVIIPRFGTQANPQRG